MAIWQPRQGIEIRLSPDQIFGFFFLRDVGEERYTTMHRAIAVVDRVDGEPFQVQLTILPAIPYLALPMSGRVNLIPHGFIKITILALRSEHAGTFSQHLVQRVARHLSKRRIDADNDAIAIGYGHGFTTALVHHGG